MWLVFFLYALFASVFVIAKAGLYYVEPLFLVGTRMAAAGIILIAYQTLWKNEFPKPSKKEWWLLFQLAFFNIYLTNACEFWGLKYLTASKTCLIYSISPFLSALFSFFLFHEKLTKRKWIGLGIGFFGLLPIILTQDSSESLAGGLLFFSWPELSVLVAVAASVWGWILLCRLVRTLSPLTANGYSMFMGGVFCLAHSLMVENWDPFPVTAWRPFFETFIALLIVSNLMAYNLYGYLLRRFSPTFVSFAGFTTPFFTAFLGYIFLSEKPPLTFFLSSLLVFVGLFTFYREELQKSTKSKEKPKAPLTRGSPKQPLSNQISEIR